MPKQEQRLGGLSDVTNLLDVIVVPGKKEQGNDAFEARVAGGEEFARNKRWWRLGCCFFSQKQRSIPLWRRKGVKRAAD